MIRAIKVTVAFTFLALIVLITLCSLHFYSYSERTKSKDLFFVSCSRTGFAIGKVDFWAGMDQQMPLGFGRSEYERDPYSPWPLDMWHEEEHQELTGGVIFIGQVQDIDSDYVASGNVLIVSMNLIVLLTSLFGLALLFFVIELKRRYSRSKIGLCRKCGYDLRYLESDRCPECGVSVKDRTELP